MGFWFFFSTFLSMHCKWSDNLFDINDIEYLLSQLVNLKYSNFTLFVHSVLSVTYMLCMLLTSQFLKKGTRAITVRPDYSWKLDLFRCKFLFHSQFVTDVTDRYVYHGTQTFNIEHRRTQECQLLHWSVELSNLILSHSHRPF